MICLSLANASVKEAKELMNQFDLVELRLDKLAWNEAQLKELVEHAKNCILTCRKSENQTDEERKALLSAGINLGAKLVDLDMNNEGTFNDEIISEVKAKGVKLIISYHNYERTPPLPILKKYVEQHFLKGADLSKIACQCSNSDELSRIFSLYYHYNNLLAIGMGTFAKISRLAALDLGAPFSYVSLTKEATAPGQMSSEDFSAIRKSLYD